MNSISDKKWGVCASLIAGLLPTVAPYRASGQSRPGESPSNIECVEHVEIPDYPPVARRPGSRSYRPLRCFSPIKRRAERRPKSARKAVRVDRFFREGAEKALKNSRFSETCGGKTITLVFHYELRDDPNRSSLFAFGPPNHFWIRYGPVYVIP